MQLPMMSLDRNVLRAYQAQAKTPREKVTARFQGVLAKTLLEEGLERFNEVIDKMLAAAHTNQRLADQLGDKIDGLQKGLAQVKKLVNRDLLKPSLVDANSKMGRVLSFSILPVLSCPDSTDCAAECYALRLVYKRHSSWATFQSYLRNQWLLHYRPDIVKEATLQAVIRARKKYSEFRLNVSGDVENQQVADFWTEVNSTILSLGTRAYGYTKAPVVAPHLLRSLFILGKSREEAKETVLHMLNDGQHPAVTGHLDQLKLLQKDVKGLVICPELMAKHKKAEKIPGCDVCGLCSKVVNDPTSKITSIGFPLH